MNGSNPVALITGASSGIGEVFARRLSAQGYFLILVARRKERLEKLAAELCNAEVLAADLTNEADLHLVECRIAAEPRLEFLVNNAGFNIHGVFFQVDQRALEKIYCLHVIAIERLTHAALKGMVERLKGNIINVSSLAGFLNNPFNGVTYCSTKAWIIRFTEGLYVELRSLRSPVRVQVLCPGLTQSGLHDIRDMHQSGIPKGLCMSAVDVVDESLRSIERNKLIVIPGWRYRLLFSLLCLFPRSWKHLAAIKYANMFHDIALREKELRRARHNAGKA
jgi:short-subunit dehydrogenase